MVRAYLRYEAAAAGPGGAVCGGPLARGGRAGAVLAAGLEGALEWDARGGRLLGACGGGPEFGAGGGAAQGASSYVTEVLGPAPGTAGTAAAGYSDGSLRLWELPSVSGASEGGRPLSTFRGHKGGITALRWGGAGGHLLASGSNDTNVIVWDCVGEQGLCRLRGHRGAVTDLAFVEERPPGPGGRAAEPLHPPELLVSCSKDGIVRVWSLEAQRCVQVLPIGVEAGVSEVWSLDVDPLGRRLVLGASDNVMRLYTVDAEAANRTEAAAEAADGQQGEGLAPEEAVGSARVLAALGKVVRKTQGRTARLRWSPDGSALAVAGTGRQLELWRPAGQEEALRRQRRRRKRRREKERGRGEDGGAGAGADGDTEDAETAPEAGDDIVSVGILLLKSKVRGFCFLSEGLSPPASSSAAAAVARLAVGLGNNSFEVHDVGAKGSEKVHTVDREGHRSDVRALALASDDSVLATCSHEEVKVWSPSPSGISCLRSIDSGYGLSAAFLPGDRHLILGTKQGQIELFNVESGEALPGAVSGAGEAAGEPAHKGEVWAVAVNPNGREVASAGADGKVRFWELQVTERGGRQALSLQLARTLELPEAVLCLQYSPDGKHIACGLLDSSIKVFFCDTLKFFLSMFGHRLPVLSLDISSDGALLASGSADKNIKVWGMDFGDCHKSLFAHPDSVTQVRFVRNTHYLFSAGKDGSVKYWDMDAREQLLTLEPGHQSACWGLAVSAMGDFVISGGHDKALRRWDRTEEPFFLEEERERRLESLFEQGAEGPPTAAGADGAAVVGEPGSEALSGTDRIIEALELASTEEQARAEPGGAERAPNPILLGLSPSAYVLRAVRSVRAPDLEQALLLLPFTDALRVLEHCLRWLGAEEGAAKGSGGSPVEVTARVAALIVRLHLGRLAAAPAARELLVRLRAALRGSLGATRDLLGVNLAALALIRP